MSKSYGPRYNPELRQTELGKHIYQVWRTVRRHPHCEEWGYFPTFYEWAVRNGCTLETRLSAKNSDALYGPNNCVFILIERTPRRFDKNTERDAWADSWNDTVNRIRKQCGMPPLEGTDYERYLL